MIFFEYFGEFRYVLFIINALGSFGVLKNSHLLSNLLEYFVWLRYNILLMCLIFFKEDRFISCTFSMTHYWSTNVKRFDIFFILLLNDLLPMQAFVTCLVLERSCWVSAWAQPLLHWFRAALNSCCLRPLPLAYWASILYIVGIFSNVCLNPFTHQDISTVWSDDSTHKYCVLPCNWGIFSCHWCSLDLKPLLSAGCVWW